MVQESESDSGDSNDIGELEFTPVEPSLFEVPEPISKSGGTAAFFSMVYAGPQSGPDKDRFGRSPSYWIGKDLARAKDELKFYEGIQYLDPDSSALLTRWAMPYGGVFEGRCHTDKGSEDLEPDRRKLLLLGNLHTDFSKLRMLDIKIGEETAVENWQGKGAAAARRQRVLDSLTNSAKQGFRLEGFDGQPDSLKTQQEGTSSSCTYWGKKAKRFELQRMTAYEFLHFWIDTTDLQEYESTSSVEAVVALQGFLFPIEYSECILFDAVRQLATLVVDAQKMPVPQMWIGSSLALCCESGALVKRQWAVERLNSPVSAVGAARIHVFDWGRSELNTWETDAALKAEDREMRSDYWDIWLRGVLRILFDCAVLYRRQFTMAMSPDCTVDIDVFDYDTLNQPQHMGRASLRLAPTNGFRKLKLYTLGYSDSKAPLSTGSIKKTLQGAATVEVQVEQLTLPARDSRLTQAWRVTIKRCQHLPNMDLFSLSDPFVHVTIKSPDSQTGPRTFTKVVWNNNNAVFDTPLDVASAKPEISASLVAQLSAIFGEPVSLDAFMDSEDTSDGNAAFVRFLRGSRRFRSLASLEGRKLIGARPRRWGTQRQRPEAESEDSTEDDS